MTKTSHSQPMQRQRAAIQSIQPWLRDQYTMLRTETGPRWQQARAVVVPVLADTSNRVRTELVPAAVHLSSRATEEAMHRSAPLRAEVSGRAAATLAAARGQVSASQIEQLKRARGHGRRNFWLISGAAAVGAAVATAAVLWQRSRYQAWIEDEAVQNTISESGDAEPERLGKKTDRDRDIDRLNTDMDRDDPSDADAGSHEDEQASTSGKHRQHH